MRATNLIDPKSADDAVKRLCGNLKAPESRRWVRKTAAAWLRAQPSCAVPLGELPASAPTWAQAAAAEGTEIHTFSLSQPSAEYLTHIGHWLQSLERDQRSRAHPGRAQAARKQLRGLSNASVEQAWALAERYFDQVARQQMRARGAPQRKARGGPSAKTRTSVRAGEGREWLKLQPEDLRLVGQRLRNCLARGWYHKDVATGSQEIWALFAADGACAAARLAANNGDARARDTEAYPPLRLAEWQSLRGSDATPYARDLATLVRALDLSEKTYANQGIIDGRHLSEYTEIDREPLSDDGGDHLCLARLDPQRVPDEKRLLVHGLGKACRLMIDHDVGDADLASRILTSLDTGLTRLRAFARLANRNPALGAALGRALRAPACEIQIVQDADGRYLASPDTRPWRTLPPYNTPIQEIDGHLWYHDRRLDQMRPLVSVKTHSSATPPRITLDTEVPAPVAIDQLERAGATAETTPCEVDANLQVRGPLGGLASGRPFDGNPPIHYRGKWCRLTDCVDSTQDLDGVILRRIAADAPLTMGRRAGMAVGSVWLLEDTRTHLTGALGTITTEQRSPRTPAETVIALSPTLQHLGQMFDPDVSRLVNAIESITGLEITSRLPNGITRDVSGRMAPPPAKRRTSLPESPGYLVRDPKGGRKYLFDSADRLIWSFRQNRNQISAVELHMTLGAAVARLREPAWATTICQHVQELGLLVPDDFAAIAAQADLAVVGGILRPFVDAFHGALEVHAHGHHLRVEPMDPREDPEARAYHAADDPRAWRLTLVDSGKQLAKLVVTKNRTLEPAAGLNMRDMPRAEQRAAAAQLIGDLLTKTGLQPVRSLADIGVHSKDGVTSVLALEHPVVQRTFSSHGIDWTLGGSPFSDWCASAEGVRVAAMGGVKRRPDLTIDHQAITDPEICARVIHSFHALLALLADAQIAEPVKRAA